MGPSGNFPPNAFAAISTYPSNECTMRRADPGGGTIAAGAADMQLVVCPVTRPVA